MLPLELGPADCTAMVGPPRGRRLYGGRPGKMSVSGTCAALAATWSGFTEIPSGVRQARRRVRLTRLDAGEFIRDRVPRLPERSLVNIDPPYFQRGPELYTSFYGADDHAALATAVRALGRPWMLTYDNASKIRQLYAGLPMFWKTLNYFAQVKRVGVELLVLTSTLKMPASVGGLRAAA